MKYCTNCGTNLKGSSKFCPNCGVKIENVNIGKTQKASEKSHIKSTSAEAVITKINKDIEIQNNQTSITKKLWYAAVFFLLIIIIAFMEIVSIHPAIVFLSFFFFLSSVVIGFMFRSREKKLQKLITGENLLAEWTMSDSQKRDYVNYLFENEKNKNKIILYIISGIAAVVFGVFILVIDEGKLFMFLVYIGLVVFLSFFALGMPYYYKIINKKNDGRVLIGSKYAYINGFFHNWDFLLSGLSKVKVIKEPFYGINLVYYYTDRTLNHSEELFIPVDKNIDLKILIKKMKELN